MGALERSEAIMGDLVAVAEREWERSCADASAKNWEEEPWVVTEPRSRTGVDVSQGFFSLGPVGNSDDQDASSFWACSRSYVPYPASGRLRTVSVDWKDWKLSDKPSSRATGYDSNLEGW